MASNFLKITNNDEWQELLNKVLFKTFFHNRGWEEFLEKNFKWLKFEHYNWQDKALLSFCRAKVWGKEKLISHPFCEYGGPLPLIEKIDGLNFRTELFSEFKEPLRINFHPQLLNYFNNLGSEDLTTWRKTYHLEQFPLSVFRYDVRHAIKKAEKQKFIFEECRSEKDLRNFYHLYVKTMKRHKNIPLPFSFFQFFNKNAKIFFLKSNGQIATGSVFLPNKPFWHYFITASDLAWRKRGVNHLLLWQVIKEYLNQDYNVMDLGATREGSDLEVFKRGWRGKELPIYEMSNRSGGTKLRQSKLRNVLGFLPSFLIEKASPHLLKYKL